MKDKVRETILEIYRELYKQAEPSVDFDAIWKMAGDIPFYEYFYLDMDEQNKITEKIMKERRCTKIEKEIIRYEILLGASPSSVKEDV